MICVLRLCIALEACYCLNLKEAMNTRKKPINDSVMSFTKGSHFQRMNYDKG